MSDDNLLHIKYLYPQKTVAAFRDELEYLLQHFEPASLAQIIEAYHNPKAHTGKPLFHCTFDDGLAECHSVIAPILKEYGLSATFFINSAFVDNADLMFRYKASLLIEEASMNKRAYTLMSDFLQAQGIWKQSLPETILALSYNQSSVLDELAALAQLDFKAFLHSAKPYMSTAQIQDLQQQGFTIGSHSHDHPLFAKIGLLEQLKQTHSSADFINELAPQSISSFAFPFTDDGVGQPFFEQLDRNKVAYTFGGAGLKHDSAKNNLQRFAMERNLLPASTIIPAAYVQYFMKRLFGKHRINRT